MKKNQNIDVKNQNINVVDRHLVAEQLRQLSRLYVNAQKYRGKYNNMNLGKLTFLREDTQPVWEQRFNELTATHTKYETEIEKDMRKNLKFHPWSVKLSKIKGIGPVIAASLIGEIDGARYGSIAKDQKTTKADFKGYGRTFESTANLWSYAGYGVKDGKAIKANHGEQSSWNKYLKLTLYKFVDWQVHYRGPYREMYDTRKKYEAEKAPELSKLHIEYRTRRYLAKKFLSDFKYKIMEA